MKIHPIAALVKTNEENLPALLESYEERALELADLCDIIQEVGSPADAKEAADMAKLQRDLERQMEVTRTAYTKPINDCLRQINGTMKGMQSSCKRHQSRLKGLVLGYQLAVEGNPDVTDPDPECAMSRRSTWEFEVTDKSKIPVEYMEINRKVLLVMAKTTRPAIPGVKWVKRESVALR